MEPEATGRTNTKLKFNVEVNPLVTSEYQEGNFLSWKWTSTLHGHSRPHVIYILAHIPIISIRTMGRLL